MRWAFVALACGDELLDWFLRGGGALRGVAIDVSPLEGRGLFATKDLPTGTIAVTSPTSLTLRASVCLDKPKSKLHQLPTRVVANLAKSHVLVVLCMIELSDQNDPNWMPYIRATPDPSPLPLVEAFQRDLNQTFQGSQLLREVNTKMKEVQKLYAELQDYLEKPPLASWCSETRFIRTYATVESHSHSEVVAGSAVPAMLPIIDILNHRSVGMNVELRAIDGAKQVEVRTTRAIKKGEELYVSYLAHHAERRSSFYRQFAFDDSELPNDIKLAFNLLTSDPYYDDKKLRFPKHMIEAKKLYAELAYLLPAQKREDLPQALAFPHYLEISCDKQLHPQETNVMQFLRFVVAPRVPSEDECPGRPPMCPTMLDPGTETKAQRRFQQDLLKYRSEYKDFASPKAGMAAQILDDERRCLDNYLAQAGAPPPPVVGLYSGVAFLVVLTGLAMLRAQRALWFCGRSKTGTKDTD